MGGRIRQPGADGRALLGGGLVDCLGEVGR